MWTKSCWLTCWLIERAYQRWAGDEVWEGLNEMGFSLTIREYSVGHQGRMNIFVTFMNHVVKYTWVIMCGK